MLSLVHTLERFNLQSANVILESAHNHSTLWLGDFTAAIDKRWQIDNGLAAVLTVAAGLNIEPADGVEHLEIRAHDIEEYDISRDFDVGCAFIDKWLKKGPVLVHCAAGVSRSASMVICYLMRTNKWTFTKTYQFVKNKRKVIGPNPGFIQCLKEEEKRLRIGRPPLDDDLETQDENKKPPSRMIPPKAPKKFDYINQQLKEQNSKTKLNDKPEPKKKYQPPMAILSREAKPERMPTTAKEEKLKKMTEDFYNENQNLLNDELDGGVIRGKSGFIIRSSNRQVAKKSTFNDFKLKPKLGQQKLEFQYKLPWDYKNQELDKQAGWVTTASKNKPLRALKEEERKKTQSQNGKFNQKKGDL